MLVPGHGPIAAPCPELVTASMLMPSGTTPRRLITSSNLSTISNCRPSSYEPTADQSRLHPATESITANSPVMSSWLLIARRCLGYALRMATRSELLLRNAPVLHWPSRRGPRGIRRHGPAGMRLAALLACCRGAHRLSACAQVQEARARWALVPSSPQPIILLSVEGERSARAVPRGIRRRSATRHTPSQPRLSVLGYHSSPPRSTSAISSYWLPSTASLSSWD